MANRKIRAKREGGKRAAETAKDMAGSAIDAGASLILGAPAGIAVAAGRRLFVHAKGIFEARRDRRIDNFHCALLDGVPAESVLAIESRLTDDEDAGKEYAAVLARAVQDDEDEKVAHYSSLMRFLLDPPAEMNPEPVVRRHLIRALAALTTSDLKFLAELFNKTGYRPPREATEEGNIGILDLLDESPLHRPAAESLSTWGLASPVPLLGETPSFKVTRLGRLFIFATGVETRDPIRQNREY